MESPGSMETESVEEHPYTSMTVTACVPTLRVVEIPVSPLLQ